MNDTIFSNSFFFNTLSFGEFHLTDNRAGITCHYFAYMISGKCKIVTDTQTVQISEGEILYLPNKCRYRSYWYGNPEVKFISLGFNCMPNFENRTYPPQALSSNAETKELFLSFLNIGRLNAADIGRFYTLVGILLPQMCCEDMCRSKEIISLAYNCMLLNPFAKIPEIARQCSISEAAVYAAFQKSSDITPNEMRNNILLEKAKDLLVTTDKTIENISEQLGYSSAAYFRKKFKQYFKITPRQMRKMQGI